MLPMPLSCSALGLRPGFDLQLSAGDGGLHWRRHCSEQHHLGHRSHDSPTHSRFCLFSCRLSDIKQSAVSAQRVFIVEVMGSYCGYLAELAGLSTGAEKIYLHEDGVHIRSVENDIAEVKKRFQNKRKNIALIIRNENASPVRSHSILVDCSNRAHAPEGVLH